MHGPLRVGEISTNFKFVPWQNVASGFGDKLDIDPVSENPRGSAGDQLNLLKQDLVVLQGRSELTTQDANTLRVLLTKAGDALGDGNEKKTASILVDFRDETRRAREKKRISPATEDYLNGGANLVRDLVEASDD